MDVLSDFVLWEDKISCAGKRLLPHLHHLLVKRSDLVLEYLYNLSNSGKIFINNRYTCTLSNKILILHQVLGVNGRGERFVSSVSLQVY